MTRRKNSRRRRGMERALRRTWLKIAIASLAALVVGGITVAALASRPGPVSSAAPSVTLEPVEASGPPVRIGIIGDSWAGGTGADPSGQQNSYAARAARLLDWGYKVYPQGGQGYTTDPSISLGSRVPELVEYAPDVVLVQGSSNDYRATYDEINAAASALYAQVREQLPDARVYALGPIDSPGSPDDRMNAARAAVADAAAANGVTYIDGNGMGWIPREQTYFADAFHPTNEGHQLVAAGLAAYLEQQGIERAS